MTIQIEDAPGLAWRKRQDGDVAYWVAPAALVKLGFTPKSERLWPPADQPHPGKLLQSSRDMIAKRCQVLSAEGKLYKGGGSRQASCVQQDFDGTVRGLSRAYQVDPDSEFHGLRHRVQRAYLSNLTIIEDTIGDRLLANLKGRWFKQCYREWNTKADGTEYAARAYALMSMFRILINFGAGILEDEPCQRIKALICAKKGEHSAITFSGGRRRRETTLSAEQVIAIRKMAHQMGYPYIALAQAVQFELAMRPKDAVGEWIPTNYPGVSDILARGLKWVCGIHWREITDGLILTHKLSKSMRGRKGLVSPGGKVRSWDLKLSPMIMEELAHIPVDRRVGPLIVNPNTGLPMGKNYYASKWREIADAAGIPKEVQNRDTRAGALTETEQAAGLDHARATGGHSKQDTTAIYIRAENEKIAYAAVERAKRRTNKTSNVCSNGTEKS